MVLLLHVNCRRIVLRIVLILMADISQRGNHTLNFGPLAHEQMMLKIALFKMPQNVLEQLLLTRS
jgi:hypothetical protein